MHCVCSEDILGPFSILWYFSNNFTCFKIFWHNEWLKKNEVFCFLLRQNGQGIVQYMSSVDGFNQNELYSLFYSQAYTPHRLILTVLCDLCLTNVDHDFNKVIISKQILDLFGVDT